MQSNFEELRSKIKGKVLYDKSSLIQYATDASIYQMMPEIVVIPKDENDVRLGLEFARRNKLTISPRGSATSLAGQAVNKGMIFDFTMYFNNIVHIEYQEKTAVVQPGVTRDQLNKIIEQQGFHFAPDPATTSRATFGGMIANNSSGTKSILYGKTSDHVVSLKIMLSDGEVMVLEDLNLDNIDEAIEIGDRKAKIYQSIRSLIFQNTEEIQNRFPKTMRRVGGYALDAFINQDIWNLSNLIIGSEGTLALILEAKIKLTPLPKFQNMCIVHFDDRIKSIEAVRHMVPFGPAAIEMLDHNVLHLSKYNHTTKKYYEKTIVGEPAAVMTVEFYGQTKEEINTKMQGLQNFLTTCPGVFAATATDDKEIINAALALRKDGLGLIMSKPSKIKGIPFIEDAAIPLEHLAEYISTIEIFCESLGVETVLYAHASVGVLHVRPSLDLMNGEDVEKLKIISAKAFDLVKKYNGSWSSEHGDGRVRSYKMKEFYGEIIYGLFEQIKNIFDPLHLLNPNIILEAPQIDEHMRYGEKYHDQEHSYVYNYRHQQSFEGLVHNCSGVGACRNYFNGTMCPSFRATGMEADSTRGRANVLRMAMSGQANLKGLTDPEVAEVMDLCLSCKACKSECPSNVDMAKLKSEVQQKMHEKNGAKLSEKMVKYNHKIAKLLTGPLAPFVNTVMNFRPIKSLIGGLANVHPHRTLPKYSSKSLVHWYEAQNRFTSDKKVLLFADTYINYYETHMGKSAIELLNACGYEVVLKDIGCCQRPAMSKGFLKDAKNEGSITMQKIYSLLQNGMKMVTIEPSCHSALTDDLPDLMDDQKMGEGVASHILSIEDFIVSEYRSGNIKGTFHVKENQKHIIHGHCHQKASYGTKSSHELLRLAGIDYSELNSGCCGMAGGFGYEKNHYDISKKIFDISFAGKLHQDECVIANGFSCRHQIADFSDKKAKHIVECLEFRSENN